MWELRVPKAQEVWVYEQEMEPVPVVKEMTYAESAVLEN
jgi:hypothetical protein